MTYEQYLKKAEILDREFAGKTVKVTGGIFKGLDAFIEEVKYHVSLGTIAFKVSLERLFYSYEDGKFLSSKGAKTVYMFGHLEGVT